MTSAESLRHRYHIQDQASEASSHSSASNDSTSQTTAVSSKASTGQISSQSAQFRDFQSALNRQKKVFEKQETQFSDRFATIERQFYRFNDLDQKLEDVQTDFSSRLNLLEGRILHSVKDELMKSSSAMETRMDKLMTAVESVVVSQKGITAATKVLQKSASSSRSGSSSNESKSSEMSLESIAIVKSPDQKRLKSRERKSKKYPLKDSFRHSLDNLNAKSMDLNSSIANPSEIQLPLSDSDESMEHLYRQMDDLAKHTSCPEHSLKTTSHDLESQYTASQDDTVDNKAPTSPGRAKSP
jgi:archaellum component FlaC